MHELEHAILGVFKESPEATRSTTELVQMLLPHEWTAMTEQLQSMDSHQVRRGKDAKARLHRKLLYHVNKLVGDGLIRIHALQGRGEKRFALAIGDVEIKSGRKQIRIHKPTKISTPVDDLPEAIVFDHEHWLDKVNAVLVEGTKHDTFASLADFLVRISPFVNDVIGVVRADTLLEGTLADYDVFIEQMKRVSCSVSLLMSVSKLSGDVRLVRFCRVLAEKSPKNISVVFNVTPQSLQERREVLTRVVELFSQHDVKVNMKNSATNVPPVVCGTAGPYTLTQKDWDSYQEQRAQGMGVVMCGASIAIDVSATEQVHKSVRKAAEALFLVGRAQNIRPLHALGIVTGVSTEIVRLWNYDLKKELLLAEIDSSISVTEEFCSLQERVYRACGLPIRCQVMLSCAFGKFPGLPPREYKKKTIKGLPSLQDEEYSEYLLSREGLAKRFIADRVRIFRSGSVDAVAIIREFGYLLNTYALPYITYDFHGLQGTVQLTEFFGGAP